MTHFVLLLFAGDYRNASARRAAGLDDRYRHHSYALRSLESIQADGARVSVIQFRSDVTYDEVGVEGIRYIGIGSAVAEPIAAVEHYLRSECATHVMVRFPDHHVIQHVVALPLRVTVVLADSFPAGLRYWRRHRAVARILRHSRVDFVANHNLNSSRQLVRVMRLDPGRVVPWDWPLDLGDLAATSAKTAPNQTQLRLAYVGTISQSKGVHDLLVAVGMLRDLGVDVRLDIAGHGHIKEMWEIVDSLTLRDHILYRGRVGGTEAIRIMQDASFVCLPSRHGYPEGLPLTIYEAMASGTPLIASDHPMFAGVVRDGDTGFVFPAADPSLLVAAVLRAWSDSRLYERVSAMAASEYPKLGVTTLWGEMTRRWVRGHAEDIAWLKSRTLRPLPASL